MVRDELIKNMRGRVERCRRLARGTTDLDVARILDAMAEEIEVDIRRLLSEQARALELAEHI